MFVVCLHNKLCRSILGLGYRNLVNEIKDVNNFTLHTGKPHNWDNPVDLKLIQTILIGTLQKTLK